jgi:hypothetical protein
MKTVFSNCVASDRCPVVLEAMRAACPDLTLVDSFAGGTMRFVHQTSATSYGVSFAHLPDRWGNSVSCTAWALPGLQAGLTSAIPVVRCTPLCSVQCSEQSPVQSGFV